MHDLNSKAFRARFALTPVALVACTLYAGTARGQEEQPLMLKPSTSLREDIPEPVREQQPTFLSGQRVFGRTDLETVIEGDAQLRRGTMVIHADHLE